MGGGVALGIAHIGVLKALQKENIKISYIAATSMGAVIASAYAAGLPIEKMEEIARETNILNLLKLAVGTQVPFSSEVISKFVKNMIGDVDFKDLKIPLSIVATDLLKGKPCVISSGSVPFAVRASASFPGFFMPVEYKHSYLIDGGASNNLPVDVLKQMGADVTIAVDVVRGDEGRDIPQKFTHIVFRSLDIMVHRMSLENRKKADVLIDAGIPLDIWHLDLHRDQELIAAGQKAAAKQMLKIKKLIRPSFF